MKEKNTINVVRNGRGGWGMRVSANGGTSKIIGNYPTVADALRVVKLNGQSMAGIVKAANRQAIRKASVES